MNTIKIKAGNRTISVPEDDFLRAMHNWCATRFAKTHREIILEANDKKEFVVVPYSDKLHKTNDDELD